jgi:hypothetical protein
MAATTTTSFPILASTPPIPATRVRTNRRRRIIPRTGRALEILAHAIEYLTYEYVNSGSTFPANNEQLQAVKLLMELNRQVYFECSEVPSLSERCLALLHLHTA